MCFSRRRFIFRFLLIIFSVALLLACKAETGKGSGVLVLSITDAPVDSAEQVIVEFSGVEIQPESGDRIQINYPSPKTINLLALQGGLRATLLEQLDLEVGTYSWIRLKVNAVADGIMDSFIRINGADYELHVPSGSNNGLKLNNSFYVGDGEIVDFTIDFDLRKSVHQPSGQTGPSGDPIYFLRPTLRLVDTNESGVVTGLINPLIFDGLSCSTPELGYGVYLYKGNETPDDIDGIYPDPESTATATLNASSDYVYTLAFIKPGDYTIAATCVADLDEPDTDDAGIEFVGVSFITVNAGSTTTHDFQP